MKNGNALTDSVSTDPRPADDIQAAISPLLHFIRSINHVLTERQPDSQFHTRLIDLLDIMEESAQCAMTGGQRLAKLKKIRWDAGDGLDSLIESGMMPISSLVAILREILEINPGQDQFQAMLLCMVNEIEARLQAVCGHLQDFTHELDAFKAHACPACMAQLAKGGRDD